MNEQDYASRVLKDGIGLEKNKYWKEFWKRVDLLMDREISRCCKNEDVKRHQGAVRVIEEIMVLPERMRVEYKAKAVGDSVEEAYG
jgi:hypothetical protein